MEKREPSLTPEWLRSRGNGSGVGSKNHIHSSSARSGSSMSHTSKSRNPKTKPDVDSVRSPFLDGSSSNDARRRFSNGSNRNAYSNFYVQKRGRGNDRRMQKDRQTYIDPWDHDTSFPLGTFLKERNQEQLRRSNPMTTKTQDQNLAQGFTMGFKNGRGSRGFPWVKTEERNEGGPDVVRISSPGLSLAVKSLSVDNSGLAAGEGSEVPNVIEKSGSDSVANVGTSVTLTGQTRTMAQALLQAPRTGTLPQGSSMTQRLEDLGLKQLRQLIPVVPSAPKGSVLSSSSKSKTKPMVRSGETGLASFRNTHKNSSMLLGNLHSNNGSQIRPDSTKKLVILKPAVNESGSPSRITNSLAAGFQMIAAPSTPFITSVAKTQSRNAFYSALKKKTSTNISTSSSVEEKAHISKDLVVSDPSIDDIVMERVEKVSEDAEKVRVFESIDLQDEKEAEFLKSLGWDENNTEVEALTDEEIRAFCEQALQHTKVKPSLMQKLLIIIEATEDVTPNS